MSANNNLAVDDTELIAPPPASKVKSREVV